MSSALREAWLGRTIIERTVPESVRQLAWITDTLEAVAKREAKWNRGEVGRGDA